MRLMAFWWDRRADRHFPSVEDFDPEEFLEDYGLTRRSIVFSANGSYQALRRLINFIELSDQFMILEEVRLSEIGQQGVDVRVDFKVSTLFTGEVDEGADV